MERIARHPQPILGCQMPGINGTQKEKRTCIVICHWIGDPITHLYRLLRQMQRIGSGSAFDVLIVCNGGLDEPLRVPSRFNDLRPKIINRKNDGYNLAAWDCGWREAYGYEYYLFLQDQCVLRRANWLLDFEFRMDHDSGIGLLGEHLAWDRMSWDYIRRATKRDLGESIATQIDTYRSLLTRADIPIGNTGTHLKSIILFTSRKILEEVNGFPYIGPSYREAVACEIGFSRLIESRGYRISTVRGGTYEVIWHLQRTKEGHISFRYKLKWMLYSLPNKLLPRSARSLLKSVFFGWSKP
jgi:hypothetical protein